MNSVMSSSIIPPEGQMWYPCSSPLLAGVRHVEARAARLSRQKFRTPS